jgi:hypothetical protein
MSLILYKLPLPSIGASMMSLGKNNEQQSKSLEQNKRKNSLIKNCFCEIVG